MLLAPSTMSEYSVAEVELEHITAALHVLLTPDLEKGNLSNFTVGTKETVLQQFGTNIESLETYLSQCSLQPLKVLLSEEAGYCRHAEAKESVEWIFVFRILQLLKVMCLVLLRLRKETTMTAPQSSNKIGSVIRGPENPQYAPPLGKAALSIQQISTIRSALQFVTILGICPNFKPGVGIPLQLRCKTAIFFLPAQDSIGGGEESEESKRLKLWLCSTILTKMLEISELRELVVSSHLNDMLAALLQLSFGYLSEEAATIQISLIDREVSSASLNPFGAYGLKQDKEQGSLETSDECGQEQDSGVTWNVSECRKALETVLRTGSPDQVIRELMVIQSGIPQKSKNLAEAGGSQPPVWLRRACSKYLVRILSSPKGIQHLSVAMMAGGDPGSPSHWQHCRAVARVVARLPVPALQVQQYVQCVSQQLFEILHNKEGHRKFHVSHLVGSIVSEMMVTHRHHFEALFLNPLLQPLCKCLDNSCIDKEQVVVVKEEELSICLEDMHLNFLSEMLRFIEGSNTYAQVSRISQTDLFTTFCYLCLNFIPVCRIALLVDKPGLGKKVCHPFLKNVEHVQAREAIPFKVYVSGQQPQANIMSTLQPVIGILWALFCFTQEGVSSVRRMVRELIVRFLKHLNCAEAAVLLQHLCVSYVVGRTEGSFPDAALPVCFAHGSYGGIQAVRVTAERTSKLGEDSTRNAAIDVLKDLKTDGVAGELLVSLLKELTDIVSAETQQADLVLPARVERSEIKVRKEKELRRKVTLLHLIVSISETFGSECLVKPSQTLLFVKASLERVVTVCQGITEQETAIFETETMSMALGLLTAVLAGAVPIDEDHRILLDKMVPLLNIIGEGHVDESIREMARDLRIAIATRGAVWPTLHEKKKPKEKTKQEHMTSNYEHSVTKPLIEELPDPSATGATEKSSWPSSKKSESLFAALKTPVKHLSSAEEALQKSSNNSYSDQVNDMSSKPRLAKAFEQLCDPLLPVRGHALIILTKLLEARDTETLSKKDIVQKIFYENMQHGDSYLYLTAISGMSALADRFPESVVPVLAAEFAGFSRQRSDPNGSTNKLTSEHRLKLGEALMKAIRNLGETVPRYREVLLAAVMMGTRDEEPVVAASSLSNLAELCLLLRFSLGPVLHEVFNCCSCFLTSEHDIVRRAATMTLGKILEGLDKDAFTVLDSVLKDLYHLLKKLHERDADEAVRVHANMALLQLKIVASNFLFPKQSLQKKIQVLSNEDTYR